MPQGIFLTSLRGDRGKYEIPSLGAVIGVIEPPNGRWSLRRREESHPGDGGEFTLHVVFSHDINRALWDSPYEKEFTIRLGKHKQFRLTQTEGERTVLEGRSLLMEGISIWPLEPQK